MDSLEDLLDQISVGREGTVTEMQGKVARGMISSARAGCLSQLYKGKKKVSWKHRSVMETFMCQLYRLRKR